MKASLPQAELARGVATVGRAVGATAHKMTPGAGTILLAGDERGLRLSATDLDIGITQRLPAMIGEAGVATVPARLFADLINSLPGDRVDLATDATGTTSVSCARVAANVRGIDPDAFPRIPAVSGAATASLPANLLRTMIDQVTFAAATDDARPIFTGVLATIVGDRVTFAAADGFRLSVRSASLTGTATDDVKVIVPARALSELAHALPAGAEPVEITVTPNRAQILFHTGALDLVSRLIEGQYVDYARIIPRAFTTRAIVTVADLKGAIRTARYFARDNNNIVRLSLRPSVGEVLGTVTISAAADAGDNVSHIDAAIDGEPQTIAFNIVYIADALGAMPGEQVALDLSGPAHPGVLRPLDSSDYLCVVMAMSPPR